jgi:hypothetical protein
VWKKIGTHSFVKASKESTSAAGQYSSSSSQHESISLNETTITVSESNKPTGQTINYGPTRGIAIFPFGLKLTKKRAEAVSGDTAQERPPALFMSALHSRVLIKRVAHSASRQIWSFPMQTEGFVFRERSPSKFFPDTKSHEIKAFGY